MSGWEEFQRIFGEEVLKAKDVLKAIVLSYLKRTGVPFRAYSAMRSDGVLVPTSTFYNIVKELEKEGLLKKEGNGYVMTERGEEFLKENEDVVEQAMAFGKKVKIADTVGMSETLDLLTKVFKIIDKIDKQELIALAKALGNLNAELRPLLAAHLT